MSMQQALASLAAAGAIVIIIGIALVVFLIVTMWKIFEKAGVAGWKSIIPIYNSVCMFKIVGMTPWFTLIVIILGALTPDLVGSVVSSIAQIATLVIAIIEMVKLAKVFGKGGGFAVGLIFLPVIFLPILAFGDAEYVGVE